MEHLNSQGLAFLEENREKGRRMQRSKKGKSHLRERAESLQEVGIRLTDGVDERRDLLPQDTLHLFVKEGIRFE